MRAAPIIIRLPAFFAGCMLISIAAWVGNQASGRRAGLIAAMIVETSPVLIEYSTNARGYRLRGPYCQPFRGSFYVARLL